MSSTIRLRLNEILIEKQMSRRQLAKQTSLRPNTVNDLCTQPIQRLHISTLSALCDTLHVSIQDLLVLEMNN
ncbi:helix-turn-helix transcriptional regulator [Lysinibacillus sp. FSL L8-0312]|uniref:helix-turn-helix domain-containing protein n=1 Tax=unclassified Lysinibacillus TaxID=2636778 RepID=UPI0030F7D838